MVENTKRDTQTCKILSRKRSSVPNMILVTYHTIYNTEDTFIHIVGGGIPLTCTTNTIIQILTDSSPNCHILWFQQLVTSVSHSVTITKTTASLILNGIILNMHEYVVCTQDASLTQAMVLTCSA